MRIANVTTTVVLAGTLAAVGCNRQESAPSTATTAAENRATDQALDRDREAADLEKRAIDVERRWAEMEAKVKRDDRTPTAGLQSEVKEDVANIREAVANLKTTTPENWWERHEEATERTVNDIEADVLRFTGGKKAPEPVVPAEPVATSAGFEEQRTQFIARVRARLDAYEEQLAQVKAKGARETELEDTQARIDKLQDDLDRLRGASPDEWWDISTKRVDEYIDRVERSIGRLDNDKV